MNLLKSVFPHAFKATDLVPFVITLIVYLIIDVVCGFVIGLLAKLPIIGFVFAFLGSLVGLYALIGIILSVLVFIKVLK